jgi:hypothetical protein
MTKTAILMALGLWAFASDAQAGLMGQSVRAAYVVPVGTIFTSGEFSVRNFLVTGGVESTTFGTTRNVKLDIGDDYLELTSLFFGRSIYEVGQFKFKLLTQGMSFESVAVVDLGKNLFTNGGAATRFDQSRVSFSTNELTLNMAGLSLPGNAPIRLSIQASPVPELSPYAMFLIAVPLGAVAIRRRRVAC